MNRVLVLVVDILMVVTGAVLAIGLRDNLYIEWDKVERLFPYMLASAVAAVAIIELLGIDRSLWRFSALGDYLRIVVAAVCVVFTATAFSFVYNRMEGIARSIPLLHLGVTIWLMVGMRVAYRLRYLRQLRANPADAAASRAVLQSHVLLIGLNSLTDLFIKSVEETGATNCRVVAVFDPNKGGGDVRLHRVKVYRDEVDLATLIGELAVHGVFVNRLVLATPLETLPEAVRDDIRTLSQQSNMRVDMLPHLLGIEGAGDEHQGAQGQSPRSPSGDQNRASLDPEYVASLHGPYWVLKRGFDALLSGVLIILLAPVIAVLSVLVRLLIGGRAIFWQERPGLFGTPFKLYKFSSMKDPQLRDGRWLTDDERMTRFGRFLRATRLDELPQLWNILRGDMSFVGPRPLLPVDQPQDSHARLSIRPGLTGWAQVQGGRGIQPEDKLALDLWYLRNASFWLDLRIALQTVLVVLYGERIDRKAIQEAWDDLRNLHRNTRQQAVGSIMPGISRHL